jgi:serine/threonine protein kinase
VNSARRIGPFVLAETLGEGRGTVLYRAVRPEGTRPPREVCIRVARDPTDAITTARIRTEYELLRAMDNPRIPKAYGHYTEEGALAMSYFSGATLADALQARKDNLVPIAVSTALDIVIEVAHGLRHGHSITGPNGSRIIHGHLGPQRIRLTPSGEIVLVGFGAHTKGRHPAYTAPEVARGEPATVLSDQWALGAILVELVLGERLYTDVPSPIDASCSGDVDRWINRLAVEYPDLESTARTMLAPNPAERFDRSHDLLKGLLAASRRIGGTVNRRHLTSRVLAHADKLSKVRPPKDPLAPLPVQPPRRAQQLKQTNPVDEPTEPILDLGIGDDTDFDPVPVPIQEQVWFEEIQETQPAAERSLDLEPTGPPAPDPAPPFLPSEVAGMALGSVMVMLGVTYVFWVL